MRIKNRRFFLLGGAAPTASRADARATALFAVATREGKIWLEKQPAHGALWQDGNGGLAEAGVQRPWTLAG